MRAQFDQLEVISVATLSIVIEVLCKVSVCSVDFQSRRTHMKLP